MKTILLLLFAASSGSAEFYHSREPVPFKKPHTPASSQERPSACGDKRRFQTNEDGGMVGDSVADVFLVRNDGPGSWWRFAKEGEANASCKTVMFDWTGGLLGPIVPQKSKVIGTQFGRKVFLDELAKIADFTFDVIEAADGTLMPLPQPISEECGSEEATVFADYDEDEYREVTLKNSGAWVSEKEPAGVVKKDQPVLPQLCNPKDPLC